MARRKAPTPEAWVESYRLMSPEDQKRAWGLLQDAEGLLPHGTMTWLFGNMAAAQMAAEELQRRLGEVRRDEPAIRETLELRRRGMTIPQIAKEQKLTEGGVRKRFKRAKLYGMM